MSFLAVPGTRIGDCIVVSEIGRDGMAVVYLADHPGLGRKVALKLLSPELADDEGFRERFMREARLGAGIEHPNIVPVHDAGETEGLLYIAMRYVEGTDLEKLLEREARLPLARATGILHQVAAAHAKGLVHRDVKPSNALLAPGEGQGAPTTPTWRTSVLPVPSSGSPLTPAASGSSQPRRCRSLVPVDPDERTEQQAR